MLVFVCPCVYLFVCLLSCFMFWSVFSFVLQILDEQNKKKKTLNEIDFYHKTVCVIIFRFKNITNKFIFIKQ